jgi:hypothetical protein
VDRPTLVGLAVRLGLGLPRTGVASCDELLEAAAALLGVIPPRRELAAVCEVRLRLLGRAPSTTAPPDRAPAPAGCAARWRRSCRGRHAAASFVRRRRSRRARRPRRWPRRRATRAHRRRCSSRISLVSWSRSSAGSCPESKANSSSMRFEKAWIVEIGARSKSSRAFTRRPRNSSAGCSARMRPSTSSIDGSVAWVAPRSSASSAARRRPRMRSRSSLVAASVKVIARMPSTDSPSSATSRR